MTTCTSDANANILHIIIKMITMSSVHWWLILHVPETVLIDNDLHCFKPIPTHCNSSAGTVSRMWLNIPSDWAQYLGQQNAEIKAKNACCKYSWSQHRLQLSFSKCTATTASEWRPLLPVCSMWLLKGVDEILQPNRPIVRISYVISQNITVPKFKPLYQHRWGYKAHHCFVVLIKMSFQLL